MNFWLALSCAIATLVNRAKAAAKAGMIAFRMVLLLEPRFTKSAARQCSQVRVIGVHRSLVEEMARLGPLLKCIECAVRLLHGVGLAQAAQQVFRFIVGMSGSLRAHDPHGLGQPILDIASRARAVS